MENSSSSVYKNSESVYKNSEDCVKIKNLILSIDYDSGYISHNPESNLDSSMENVENLIPLSSEPIYFSEDALLETPELCKYPDINLEIAKENFEETRSIFNSPILNSCATHVSGSSESGRSQELNYSGFDSEECNISPQIPRSRQIIVDTSVENTKKNLYTTTDLQDIKREAFKNMQNINSVFSNITNTLATNDPIKKLTLVLSKCDKENLYSVKRKYRSLTPPDKNFHTASFIPTPKNMDNEFISCEENITSFGAISVEEKLSQSEEYDCSKCARCNADISKDSSFEENENSCINNLSTTEPVSECDKIKIEENQTEVSSNSNSVFLPFKKEDIKIENSSVFKSAVSGTVDEIFKGFEIQADIDVHKQSPSANLIQECKHFNEINTENFASESENIETQTENKTENYINESSLSVIKSIVSETLQDVLSNFKNTIPANDNNEESSENLKDNTSNINIEISNNNMNAPNISNSMIRCNTPEKSYNNPNSFGLSPDLFVEDQIEEKVPEEIEPTVSIPKEKNVVKKDYMVLRRAQNNLKGVIPPRSVTLMKISISEMLNKIQSNKKYFWNSSTVSTSEDTQESNSLLITSSMETCRNKEFPNILQHRCLGLYHNRSKFSEEFEELCVKYGQRYVGAETQSSCTVFETVTVSPTKRRNIKPQWNTKSPGKRLSHLARRRITFSSANLQSGSSFLAGSRARQILVDAKKIDLLSRRRSPRKSPRKTPKKTPGKSPRIKTRTPSSSAKKKLAMRFRKVTGEIEKSSASTSFDATTLSAKRTLFHSPDEDKKTNRFLPSTSGTSSVDNEIKRTASKRALFMSPSKNSPLKNLGFRRSPVKRLDFGMEKKRKRNDSDSIDEVLSKFPRCHSENVPSTESDLKSLGSRTRSELILSQSRQIKELTTNHKKKLQLAIYEALRSQNVLPTHPQFRIFASNLGRLTRKLFLMTTADCVGVTEKMLRIARQHVISVVKGKSPEEIYEEFMKQKSKNSKPQGYVAPDSAVLEKSLSEKRVAASGKCTSSENKVERIRKAINFGDFDNR